MTVVKSALFTLWCVNIYVYFCLAENKVPNPRRFFPGGWFEAECQCADLYTILLTGYKPFLLDSSFLLSDAAPENKEN